MLQTRNLFHQRMSSLLSFSGLLMLASFVTTAVNGYPMIMEIPEGAERVSFNLDIHRMLTNSVVLFL